MAIEKKMNQVILGFLSHQPMTGYDIKKRIDVTLRYFWSGSYGSIYPTLNTLVKEEKVTKEETTENGRAKITYTITNKGRDELKEWLCVPVTKDELRYETLLKLFFGSEVGAGQSVEHIKNFQHKIEQELPILQAMVGQLEQIKGEDGHCNYLVTALFGEMIYETYLKWCEKAITILEENDKE